MELYQNIVEGQAKISLIGLGYVGMPIAIAFSKKVKVIGFDVNQEKIKLYRSGVDPTEEVGDEAIKHSTVEFTWEEERLKEALFHIVAVPTPVRQDKIPDLGPVISASKTLGRNLQKGSVIVYESTVYPGVTQEVCVPILEQESGLICGKDFKVGYSPERINPGDQVHRLENIVKVVSGMDEETLETVAKVYELVALAGVYRAEAIRVSEAAKVIENAQRDINIAFMNELSIIFNKMDIDTKAVLEAASTKWNFLNFSPGLVGGHCIGVDPYYLTYKAEKMGYHSQIILAGRRINDNMGQYIAENTVKQLIRSDVSIRQAKVAIFGFTFKENCPDIRNSKVMDVVKELWEYEIEPLIYDPIADSAEALAEYGVSFVKAEDIQEMDCLIIAVAHKEFLEWTLDKWNTFFKKTDNSRKNIIDVKGILNRKEIEAAGYHYFRL